MAISILPYFPIPSGITRLRKYSDVAPSSHMLTGVPTRQDSGLTEQRMAAQEVLHGVTAVPLDQPTVIIPSTGFPKTSEDDVP